jgi:hypothetical protein
MRAPGGSYCDDAYRNWLLCTVPPLPGSRTGTAILRGSSPRATGERVKVRRAAQQGGLDVPGSERLWGLARELRPK